MIGWLGGAGRERKENARRSTADLLGGEFLDREKEGRLIRFRQQPTLEAKLSGLARPGFPQDHRAALVEDAFRRNDLSAKEKRQSRATSSSSPLLRRSPTGVSLTEIPDRG